MAIIVANGGLTAAIGYQAAKTIKYFSAATTAVSPAPTHAVTLRVRSGFMTIMAPTTAVHVPDLRSATLHPSPFRELRGNVHAASAVSL